MNDNTSSSLRTRSRYPDYVPRNINRKPRSQSISNIESNQIYSLYEMKQQNMMQISLAPVDPKQRSKSFATNGFEKGLEMFQEIEKKSLRKVRFAPGTIENSPEIGEERKLKKMAIKKASEKKWHESANLLTNVLHIQKSRLRINHPEIATSKYHLANALYSMNELHQSFRLLREALDVFLLSRNEKYALDLASVLYLLALIEERYGNIENASYYVHETQKMELKAMGFKSNKTMTKLSELKKYNSFKSRALKKVAGRAA